MPKRKANRLTEKEEMFCQEYLIDFNGTAAATRAGYKSASVDAIRKFASQLLTKPDIQYRIYELKSVRSRRLGISQDRVINELAKIAFYDVGNILKKEEIEGIEVLKINLDNECDRQVIIESDSSIEINENNGSRTTKYRNKVKLVDRTKTLELLMRHLGLLHDFDMAIACLEKYGLLVRRDEEGNWTITEASEV